MERRNLLIRLLAAGGGLLSLLLGLPAVLHLLTPARTGRREQGWRSLGSVEDFPPDQVVKATVPVQRGDWARSLQAKAVYVWRRNEHELIVYSRNCTDLSCPVTYDPGSECFFCPCHGGIFNKEGTPLAGPPSVPLYRYENRVNDGIVEINLNSLPPMT